jgi:hypothetical protein
MSAVKVEKAGAGEPTRIYKNGGLVLETVFRSAEALDNVFVIVFSLKK